MTTRTKERSEFWAGVLTTAIEHAGYGNWFRCNEYVPYWDPELSEAGEGFTPDPTQAYAIITIDDEEVEEHGNTYRVDADFLASGYSKILGGEAEMSDAYRDRLARAYAEHDAGDIDVIDALNILECAIFGEVVYA